MKHLFLSLCLSVFAVTAAHGQTTFVPGFDDLPLAPGLTATEEPVAFVTMDGRIIESAAQMSVSENRITAFYSESLPQLGWIQRSESLYERDGEALTVDIRTQDNPPKVVFRLTPGGSP